MDTKYLSSVKTQFDIIFADPPYNLGFLKYIEIIDTVFDKHILKRRGILIIEHSDRLTLKNTLGLANLEGTAATYSAFLKNKKGRPVSRIRRVLLFIWMKHYCYILAAYPTASDEPPLNAIILGVAPYRVYLISLQPNCTFFLLH